MTRKNISLILVLINFIFFTWYFYLLVQIHTQIIIDINTPPYRMDEYSFSGVTLNILGATTGIGLCWVLIILKEKIWILIGWFLLVVHRVFIELLNYFQLEWRVLRPEWAGFLLLLFYINLIYIIVNSLFIKNKSIKFYYFLYALITLFALLVQLAGPSLYDNYGVKWLLINPTPVLELTALISLLLFIRVYLNDNISAQDFNARHLPESNELN